MTETPTEMASPRRRSDTIDRSLVDAIVSRMSVLGLHMTSEGNPRHEILHYRVSPDSDRVVCFELRRRVGSTSCTVLRAGHVTKKIFAKRRRENGMHCSTYYRIPDGDEGALADFLDRVSREVRTLTTAADLRAVSEKWQAGWVANLDVSIDWIEGAARELGIPHDHVLFRRIARLSDTIRTAVLDDPNVAVHLGKASYKIAVFEAGQRLARSTPGIEDDEDLSDDTTPRSTAIPRM